MTTRYITHPRYPEHDLRGHPEHAGRIRAVWQALDDAGLTARMQHAEATPAAPDLIKAVHTATFLEIASSTTGIERTMLLDADTYVTPTSYEVALLAAGGVVDAVRAVVSSEANNAIAAVRPPGHHAMPDRAMGFCIFNNVAVGARYAQSAFGLERVLIVDYDVHHGNGTEAMFYDDPSILFISTHQWPLYPASGPVSDIGNGQGRGYNINIPLAPGNGDANYAAVFEQVVWPAALRFQPQIILVSVGHDAHWTDPLAGMRLSLRGYAHLAREMLRMAEALCEGKIVFVMEGGYDLKTLGLGWANIARVLLGDNEIDDPLGQPRDGRAEPDISALVERIQTVHRLDTAVTNDYVDED